MIKNIALPNGFKGLITSLNFKDDNRDDYCIIFSEYPCTSSAVFTQSIFAGASVLISKKVSDGRGVIVTARNSNVATGELGLKNAYLIRSISSKLIDIKEEQLYIAATGIIGKQYDMDNIISKLSKLDVSSATSHNAYRFASSIMTTDTKPKIVSRKIGNAKLIGIAKGVGMIEPNMATLLVFFFTDAKINQKELNYTFKKIINKTFNALSIDTDTSTSDTAIIFANGSVGEVDFQEFEKQLYESSLELVYQIANDGEGATKIIEVKVENTSSEDQAKRIAKSIVNSPLVKTAIHGADPNWGRIAMAIGKCEEYKDININSIKIFFGHYQVYPQNINNSTLSLVANYLQSNHVVIRVYLGLGNCEFTVYGCDLTEEYIRLNSDYSS